MHSEWWARRARVGEVGKLSAGFAWALDRLGPLVRLAHRPTLEGLENLPASGPFLLVANHSGAMAVSELATLAWLWRTRVGAERRLASLAFPFGFSVWPISFFVRRLGAIPSTRECALQALAKGIPVLVFPGGDFEASRPIWQASRVMFAGRRGFLKIAREARVPIVPMGIQGSHYTAPTVGRSRLLPYLLIRPKLLGLNLYPLTVLAVIGALLALMLPFSLPVRVLLAWAWIGSLPALMPWIPWRICYRIGKPIAATELFVTGSEDELALAYQRVESSVQALVKGA